ncbi:MAG: translation elongation factor Ts [Sedimentisphaerales bacterium]|jgi:elongation factor Ts|nr:translation elongation factor Ts [Sedimentisphaerales bacterium]HNY79466.1 translation elongation factor Ts [Sedimentisphaerales bacterium]HOC64628.1 translation elongation factor Ts [Sedimentisphaerales bacterium]HOH65421.1 translation elongation factor Ts [Sedimentisphaerales bacterium]HPY50602.1 translation elongation factor Ts [Sedimentisphaerales bacterium]
MAEISASAVMKLRNRSGQGMMDCKKALQEAAGDVDRAMEILRKKGLATLAKRAERETSNGLVVSRMADGGQTGVLVSLCCETDFVAKGTDFVTAANLLAEYALVCPADEGTDALLHTTKDGRAFNDILTEIVSKTGEKTAVGDYARFKLDGPGLLTTYIHFNSKVGTMVQLDVSDPKVAQAEDLQRAMMDIAMHITASKPLALDKSGIDPKVIEQERAVYAEQVKNKPAEIVGRIVDGKMGKFFAENCLLEQPFVKDDSKTVRQVLAEAAKAAGGTATIKRFARFEVG